MIFISEDKSLLDASEAPVTDAELDVLCEEAGIEVLSEDDESDFIGDEVGLMTIMLEEQEAFAELDSQLISFEARNPQDESAEVLTEGFKDAIVKFWNMVKRVALNVYNTIKGWIAKFVNWIMKFSNNAQAWWKRFEKEITKTSTEYTTYPNVASGSTIGLIGKMAQNVGSWNQNMDLEATAGTKSPEKSADEARKGLYGANKKSKQTITKAVVGATLTEGPKVVQNLNTLSRGANAITTNIVRLASEAISKGDKPAEQKAAKKNLAKLQKAQQAARKALAAAAECGKTAIADCLGAAKQMLRESKSEGKEEKK